MYNDFAAVYDSLMDDVDYKGRTDHIIELFERYDKKPTLLLDLACGTGGFSGELAARGISVIGVDISPEMLSVARERAISMGQDILYLCQDACELDLYGTVDGAVCCLDSLNHITDYGRFCAALSKVSLFLEKDRLFIFDVNTLYKHESVLGNNTFVIENDEVYCVWQNEYESSTHTTDITLDFFVREGEGYVRSGEQFCERAYTEDEIAAACCAAGLKIEEILDGDPERSVYVTRKVK